MSHPLVGKTITIRYETPAAAQGASFQWHFLSNNQKHAQGLGTAAGYDALHTYDLAIVAPNTYFIAWLKDDGDAVAVVLNLDDRKVYGSATSSTPARFFMLGVIDHVLDAEHTHD
jgi:hypothetical protein